MLLFRIHGEDWLVPHGERVQQIGTAGKGEVFPEGRVVNVRCCQGGALDHLGKMRSLVLATKALITYQKAGEIMIQKLAVKWKEVYKLPTKNTIPNLLGKTYKL